MFAVSHDESFTENDALFNWTFCSDEHANASTNFPDCGSGLASNFVEHLLALLNFEQKIVWSRESQSYEMKNLAVQAV